MQDKIVQEIMEAMEVFVRDRIAWTFAAGYKTGSVRGPLQKPVIQMTKKGIAIKRWDSIADASRGIGIADSSIIKVCKGRLQTSGSFKWKYSDV